MNSGCIINAEATVVQPLNIAAPEKGLYIFFGWLFLVLFFPQKKVQKIFYQLNNSFKFIAFASTAGGLRTCFVAAFDSFKKYAAHFLNPAGGGTEPKEAPSQVLVENLKYGCPMELETFCPAGHSQQSK